MTHPFLEMEDGHLIGRDPRDISEAEWTEHLPYPPVGLKAIRQYCLRCCNAPGEVRKCTVVLCPLWPFRMGTQPAGLRAVRKSATGA